MKKSTKIRKLAQEIAYCIFDNDLNVAEAEEYLEKVLCESFCDNVCDYPKTYHCDHGVLLSKECKRCNNK